MQPEVGVVGRVLKCTLATHWKLTGFENHVWLCVCILVAYYNALFLTSALVNINRRRLATSHPKRRKITVVPTAHHHVVSFHFVRPSEQSFCRKTGKNKSLHEFRRLMRRGWGWEQREGQRQAPDDTDLDHLLVVLLMFVVFLFVLAWLFISDSMVNMDGVRVGRGRYPFSCLSSSLVCSNLHFSPWLTGRRDPYPLSRDR